MAVIAGMETAKVDDVTPIGLPIEQMAKGIMAVQARADDNKNAIEQFNKDLNMELRDREEDWETFKEVKNKMYQEMKDLEESVGGDWSKVDKASVSAIAMKAAQSDEVRQLKTALENAKTFEQQQKTIEAAGSTPYHFGIDPRNASLRNPDGSWRDMRDFEVYKNPDAQKDIDVLSDKLGDQTRESVKFDAKHSHLSQEQRDELWYHLWTKSSIEEMSNIGNINSVIDSAYNLAMTKDSVKLEFRKLQQDYLRSNPDATVEQAAEYAKQVVQQMIFSSSKRKLKTKYKEDITPYFQTKPMVGGSPGGGGRGGGGAEPKPVNSYIKELTITNDGTETIGMPTYADAHNFITSRDVNITQMGKPVDQISVNEIENINILEQFAFGVPQVAGADGTNTLGFDGSFFSITQRLIGGSSSSISEERWSDNPAIIAVDRRKLADVDKIMSNYLSVNNDIGSTSKLADALFSKDYGDVEGVDIAGMSLALFGAYVDEFKERGMSSQEARDAAKSMVEQKMASYTAFNANSKYASPYELRSKEDGSYEVGVHEGSTTLMQFYDNLLEMTEFYKTENGKQVKRSDEEIAAFKEGVRKKRDYLQTRISKAQELSSNTEFIKVSESIINRRAVLDNKAAEFASRDYMLRLNAGMTENEFFTTGQTASKDRNEDLRIATAEYLSSSILALYDSMPHSMFSYGLGDNGSLKERTKAYKEVMKSRPELAKMVSTNLDLALSGRLNIPEGMNELVSAKIAKGLGSNQDKVERYFTPSYTANSPVTTFLNNAVGMMNGKALVSAISSFQTMNGTADSFYVDLTREQMKAHLSPTDREILEGLTTGSYVWNGNAFVTKVTTGVAGTVISEAAKRVSTNKVNELLFTYQEMLKINYATAGIKGEEAGPEAGFGVKGWRLGQSESNKNLVKAIENNQLNLNEYVRNKVTVTPGFKGNFNEKFTQNITGSGLLTENAKKYYVSTRESKEGYEMSVPVHWVTDETDGGKAINKWGKNAVMDHFTALGKSDGSLHAAIYGTGKEELQNRQTLIDMWNEKKEGKLTDKSFHEWVADNALIKGLTFDVDHNGSSSTTLVINFSGLGDKGAMVGDIQIPVKLEGLGTNMLYGLGWPSEISKYGEEARQSYQASGGNWIDLKSGGKAIRYHRAPTDLPNFGIGGTTIKKGQYFIIGDGNPDYALGAAKGKAQVIKEGHPVDIMKHYETAVVGPELQQMKKYQQLFHQGMNSKNPDAFFQAHLGKGMTAEKFVKFYNEKYLTSRVTTSTGGADVKK